MDEQLYMEFGETISTLTGRTLARVHPQLGVKVSPYGEVLLPKSGHWTFGRKHSKGYRRVKIAGKHYLVHRLVVEAFIQYPIPEGYQIDHANRVRDDNRLENIRICTPSQNSRNRADHDRVTEQGRTHKYEDARQYNREHVAHYKQAKRKTHRRVHFADGRERWLPLPEAEALLAIPLSQRIFKG